MRNGQLDHVLRHIRSLVAVGQTRELPDWELLERFVKHHDEAAFAAIVERHGPLVLSACRRILRSEHHAEDACQATLLVLARRAGTIRKRESLGSWLYGVASRVARKLNADVKRRAARDVTAADVPGPDTTGEITWREGLAVLDEELGRLPATYRSALILCYLEGKPQEEAAEELGCTLGALRGRLERARECLRRRLVRRGVSLSAALLGTVLVSTHAVAALPPALAIGTVKAAARLLTGQALAPVVPANVAALTEGVLTAMFVTRMKIVGALVLGMSLMAAGAGALARAARSEKETPVACEALPAALALAPAVPPQSNPAPSVDKGTKAALTVRGRVLDPDGKPFVGAKLYLHEPNLGEKDYALRATSGADGRFEFTFARSELDKTGPDYPKLDRPSSQVVAVATGLGCDWATVGAAEAERELTLRLVKDVPISGRVRDRDGKPVAGAKVRLGYVAAYPGGNLTKMLEEFHQRGWHGGYEKHWGGPLPGQARILTTAVDGRFRLAGFGRERTVSLLIEGPGIEYTSITVMTRAGEAIAGSKPLEGYRQSRLYGAEFDYLAAPSRPIRGVVRDQVTGKPVAGVTFWSYLTTHRPQTDQDGRYELLGHPKSSTYRFYLEPPDGRHFRIQVHVSDTSGLDPLAADIALPSGITVQGRVLDKMSGKPVPGVRVSYYVVYPNPKAGQLGDYHEYEGLSFATTGPDGSFAVAVLPGPGVLAAAAQPLSSYRPALVTLKELEDFLKERPDRFNSQDVLPVHGTGSLANARYEMISQSQYNALALINPMEKDKALVRDLVLLPPLSRHGRIVGPDGKPISDVTAIGLDGPVDYLILKSANFSVRGLHPERPRELFFYQKEKNLGRFLELRGEQSEPLKVELQACGSVVGRLVDKGGKPVVGAIVYFPLEHFGPFVLPGVIKVKTDQDGRLRAEGLVPGQKYTMTRRTSNIADSLPRELIVEPGKTKELGDLTVAPLDDNP